VPGSGNALFALGSATLWGGGDFSGGMGVKHAGGSLRAALRVVLLSHFASFLVLVAIALLRGDPFPHGALLAWGVGAGVAGGLSLTCFYIALSRGGMGVSAAVSGLLAAAIPAVVASFAEGSPGLRRILGFGVAGGAIWLVAAGPGAANTTPGQNGAGEDRSTAVLAILAGAGFGVYFVALKMCGPAGVVWPMATARMGSLTTCSLWALGMELFGSGTGSKPVRISRTVMLWSLATALLDTSGNLLFVAATRAGRLDVAAVLASLYPASTILLAAVILSEKPTRRQAFGMLVAAVAVGMISA
jgi:drug/metabolite transporter (DMT)-like permease